MDDLSEGDLVETSLNDDSTIEKVMDQYYKAVITIQ